MINEYYPSSGGTGSISRFEYLFRFVGLFGPKNVYIIWLSNMSNLSVPVEGYYRNLSYALKQMSAFFVIRVR